MAPAPAGGSAPPLTVEPSQPLSFRVLARESSRKLGAQIEPDGVDVELEPPRPFRITLQPDGAQLNIVPEGSGTIQSEARVTVRARCRIEGGSAVAVEASQPLRYVPAADAPPIETLTEMPFRVTHMSVYDPAIVPSFDQIGIASLAIQVRVVHVDAVSHRLVAWGVEKFGLLEDGEAVQVAVPRHLFYAFAGTYENGRLALAARDCAFELTAFPVPLDVLRLAGTWAGTEGPAIGSSLLAELDVAGRLRRWRRSTTLASSLRAVASLATFARGWMPDAGTGVRSLPLLLRFLARVAPLAVQVLGRRTYGPWGLIGDDGWFRGVGSFRAGADRAVDRTVVEVRAFRHEAAARRIVAEIAARRGHERSLGAALPGILLVDATTHEPALLRYTAATVIRREAGCVHVELNLPPSFAASRGAWRALLLLDVTPLDEIDLGAR